MAMPSQSASPQTEHRVEVDDVDFPQTDDNSITKDFQHNLSGFYGRLITQGRKK